MRRVLMTMGFCHPHALPLMRFIPPPHFTVTEDPADKGYVNLEIRHGDTERPVKHYWCKDTRRAGEVAQAWGEGYWNTLKYLKPWALLREFDDWDYRDTFGFDFAATVAADATNATKGPLVLLAALLGHVPPPPPTLAELWEADIKRLENKV